MCVWIRFIELGHMCVCVHIDIVRTLHLSCQKSTSAIFHVQEDIYEIKESMAGKHVSLILTFIIYLSQLLSWSPC